MDIFVHRDVINTFSLEKKIKNRGRQWKINLIEKTNPHWRDLSNDFLDSATTRRMTGEREDGGTGLTDILKPNRTARKSA